SRGTTIRGPTKSYPQLTPLTNFLGLFVTLWLIPTSQIFRRQRILVVLSLPEHGHDPPTLPIVHQLNAVDAARERLGIVSFVTRLVSAEDVRNVAELLKPSRDFAFEKSVLLQTG